MSAAPPKRTAPRRVPSYLTNDHPLLSSWIKLDRAEKHFNNLSAEISAFTAREPYKIIVDEDPEPAVKIYRAHIVEHIPVQWGGIIGDIIHNLRASLDCLATELVKYKGHISEAVISETYFPIRWDRGGLDNAKARAFFDRAGPEVEKFIRRLQPYRGGLGEALWRLERLDVIDKHRAIIPVGANLKKVDTPGATHPTGATFPLKEGDELFRVVFFEPHFDAHTHFALSVAFGEGQIVDGEPVLPALKQLIDFVERIVDIFGRRLLR